MTKRKITREDVRSIIDILGISNREFCRNTGLNRGAFSKIMRGVSKVSDYNEKKILQYARTKGLYKKSIIERIVDFIKG